jgi:hypothetical protein
MLALARLKPNHRSAMQGRRISIQRRCRPIRARPTCRRAVRHGVGKWHALRFRTLACARIRGLWPAALIACGSLGRFRQHSFARSIAERLSQDQTITPGRKVAAHGCIGVTTKSLRCLGLSVGSVGAGRCRELRPPDTGAQRSAPASGSSLAAGAPAMRSFRGSASWRPSKS